MRRDSWVAGSLALALTVAACGSSSSHNAMSIAEWCALANSQNQALDATPVSDQRRVADSYVAKWDALSIPSDAVPAQLTDLATQLAIGYRQIAVRVRKGEAFADIAVDPKGPLNDDLFKTGGQLDATMKASCPTKK